MLYNNNWTKPTTPAQLLRRAADLMEEHGMAKQVFIMDEAAMRRNSHASGPLGSMCIQGALMAADGATPEEMDFDYLVKKSDAYGGAIVALQKNLYSVPGWNNNPGTNSVPGWNNNPGTTKEMAVAKMREVADQLEPA